MVTSIDFERVQTALSLPAGWIELAIAVACFALGWAADRRFRVTREHAPEVVRVGLGGVNRLIFPLVSLALVVGATAIFAHFQPAFFLKAALPLAIALALAVAYVRGSLTDRMVMIVCTVGLSISILVYIIVFQYVFAYKLGWFPVQGWGDNFRENLFIYATLPIFIGLVVSIAPDLRLFRTFVLDEINQDYVRTGRAKGLSENRIMWLHVLRNASIPIITHVTSQLPGLLIGAFLIERFFSIPGIGREVILAVERSDFPVIKAITVYVAVATMIFNLLADLMYKAVDPRVQLK